MVKESPVASDTLLENERMEVIKKEADLLHQMRLIFFLEAVVELIDATKDNAQYARNDSRSCLPKVDKGIVPDEAVRAYTRPIKVIVWSRRCWQSLHETIGIGQ